MFVEELNRRSSSLVIKKSFLSILVLTIFISWSILASFETGINISGRIGYDKESLTIKAPFDIEIIEASVKHSQYLASGEPLLKAKKFNSDDYISLTAKSNSYIYPIRSLEEGDIIEGGTPIYEAYDSTVSVQVTVVTPVNESRNFEIGKHVNIQISDSLLNVDMVLDGQILKKENLLSDVIGTDSFTVTTIRINNLKASEYVLPESKVNVFIKEKNISPFKYVASSIEKNIKKAFIRDIKINESV